MTVTDFNQFKLEGQKSFKESCGENAHAQLVHLIMCFDDLRIAEPGAFASGQADLISLVSSSDWQKLFKITKGGDDDVYESSEKMNEFFASHLQGISLENLTFDSLRYDLDTKEKIEKFIGELKDFLSQFQTKESAPLED